MPAAQSITRLIEHLASIPATETLANPYATERTDLDAPGGAAQRRGNCERYLRTFIDAPPRLVIVGEAAGYQGCRFSGIAFTSEHTLANHSFFKARGYARSGIRERLFREPSGSIVWETIDQMEHVPVLWNTVPFHPHRPGEPLSNRTPTRSERELGGRFLKELLALFGAPKVAAAGKISSETLTQLEIPHVAVRHPAYGGKSEFQRGILAVR